MEFTDEHEPTHPMVGACAVVDEVMGEMAGFDPIYMDPTSKKHTLVALSILTNRLEGIRLGVIAASGDVAEADGARNAGAWWGHATREDHHVARATHRLATSLTRWTMVADALCGGDIHRHHAEAITRALDDLPTDLGPDLLEQAEKFLLTEAAHLTPRQLRILGARVLEYIAPDVFDELERQRLERQDAAAAAATRLGFRRRGDGTTDLTARIPDHVATRLKTYLDAFTNPRRDHHNEDGTSGSGDDGTPGAGPACTGGRVDPATGERLGYPRLLGEAFAALLEALPSEVLPIHGGTATTLNITINLEALKTGLGTGTLDDDTPITAAHARRLACTAGLLPAVLGTKSEVLDLGRTSRFYNTAQRKALGIQQRHCRTEGCTMPARWCEAHHREPWAAGGRTDLAEADLLCCFHHHRVHDPAYTTTRLPSGELRFHRRT